MVSSYLLAIVTAWVVAQGAKYLIEAVQTKSIRRFRQLYSSGDMPSAHTASVVALATVIGLSEGVDSAIFALSVLFASIIMYDAVMVRRSSGEQGAALQQLLKDLKSTIVNPRAAKGHTPQEVLAGAVLGGVIGLVVFFATQS